MNKKLTSLFMASVVLSNNVFPIGIVSADELKENSIQYQGIDNSEESTENKDEIIKGRNSNDESVSIDDWMPDKNLQNALVKALSLDSVSDLTQDTLKNTSVKKIDISNKNITNLNGIEYLTNIDRLDISSNNILDFSPVSNLTQLTWLTAQNSKLTDISFIEPLTNITRLVLSHNNIKSLDSLSNLYSLNEIAINYNDISDLSPINDKPIKILTFDSNQVYDLSMFSNSTFATRVYSHTQQVNYPEVIYSVPGSQKFVIDNPVKDGMGNPIPIISDYYSSEDNTIIIPIDQLKNNTFLYRGASNINGLNSVFDGIISFTLKVNKTTVNVHDSSIHVGDNWRAEDNFDSAVDKDGNSVELSQITVDDSDLDVTKPGQYKVIYTYDGVTVTASVTVTQEQAADVTAKYIDLDGNKISDDLVKSGNIGEAYTTEQKDIPGYTFKEVQGNVSGKFKDQPQTVTYVYAKNRANTVNPEPKPDSKDKNNNQGITSSDQHNLPTTGENERMTMMSIILGLILTALATVVSIFRFKKVKK